MVTATNMPKLDVDLGELVNSLTNRGLSSEIVAWDRADVVWRAFDLALIKSPWDYFGRQVEFLNWIASVSRHTKHSEYC
jgi:hypothetical protein